MTELEQELTETLRTARRMLDDYDRILTRCGIPSGNNGPHARAIKKIDSTLKKAEGR